MEFAVLARPQWRDILEGQPDRASDPRIVFAPLQELELIKAGPQPLQDHLAQQAPWIILTSPASALAFRAHTDEHQISLSKRSARFVAVGTGTRDQLCRLFSWLQPQDVLISADPDRADAASTLTALDEAVLKMGLQWHLQQFLLIEGQDNRATLTEGLEARKAKVSTLALYARREAQWPEGLWNRLAQSMPKQAGIIITSSAVIERLLQTMTARGLDPKKFHWCTQHPTIAARLLNAGLGPVGRIRLDAQQISDDLFSHGQNW